jgi:hypothetical protein
MKKLSYSLIGLSFIATAAYAQPAPDGSAGLPAPDAATSVPGDTLPSEPADTLPAPAETLPAPADTLPAEPVPSDALPPEPAPPADPLADSTDATGAAFTDAQIDSFAAATVKVQQIDADATIDAETKQTQMAAAVTEAGLDPATYNEMGAAIAADAELRTKVQTAMARHATPSDG